MRSQLTKWGNSVAVRLPKAMLQAARLQAGDTVEIEVPEGGGILVRSQNRWPSIDERIESITPETLHPATETGPPVGNEFW